MGNFSSSKLEKALGSAIPPAERFVGLENFGSTCYCNSVLQSLYGCRSFRRAILLYAKNNSIDLQQNSIASTSSSSASSSAASSSRATQPPVAASASPSTRSGPSDADGPTSTTTSPSSS
eukprot:CAMPEP_0174242592 /NCGR_PEP_ID=MMETSP0417-20130205/28504_1 /TAXON_ID=242541 /ORGANISM="Mayorella sp, Strain BSH-02190019" /LENGTH=119 /DNA_ID=CAMNT_0015322009 /DNA_START=99 /DNA_END=454 /DNA_ORIENTATION=+